MNRLLLYLGNTLIGDINKFAKNRHLTETLKSESDSATADTFTFDINWKVYQEFVRKAFDDEPGSMLRVGKTRVVFETDGYVTTVFAVPKWETDTLPIRLTALAKSFYTTVSALATDMRHSPL